MKLLGHGKRKQNGAMRIGRRTIDQNKNLPNPRAWKWSQALLTPRA